MRSSRSKSFGTVDLPSASQSLRLCLLMAKTLFVAYYLDLSGQASSSMGSWRGPSWQSLHLSLFWITHTPDIERNILSAMKDPHCYVSRNPGLRHFVVCFFLCPTPSKLQQLHILHPALSWNSGFPSANLLSSQKHATCSEDRTPQFCVTSCSSFILLGARRPLCFQPALSFWPWDL